MTALVSASARAVWRDGEKERGAWSVERERWALLIDAYAYADAYADADADAYADADADAYADAYAYAYAYADADAYAYADADADAYSIDSKEEYMQGLYAVTLWQGGGRMVLRVGWFRPRGNDGTHEVSWCTVYRQSASQRLAELWTKGPKAIAKKAGIDFSEPVQVDDVQRLHVVPLARLDAKLWGEVCPRPEGWE